MDTNELIESFEFRFKASGIREPGRTAEELVACVLNCHSAKVHHRETPTPPSSGQMMEIIRKLEQYAVRIENGEEPQAVLGCPDF